MEIQAIRLLLILVWCTGNFLLIIFLLTVLIGRLPRQKKETTPIMPQPSEDKLLAEALCMATNKPVEQQKQPSTTVKRRSFKLKRNPNMTKEEKDKITKLLLEGWSAPRIAKEMKLNPWQVWNFRTRKKTRKHISNEVRDTIVSLYKKGEKIRDIAEKVGFKLARTTSIIQRHNKKQKENGNQNV